MKGDVFKIVGSRGQYLRKRMKLGDSVTLHEKNANVFLGNIHRGKMEVFEIVIGPRDVSFSGVQSVTNKKGFLTRRYTRWLCIPKGE